MQGGGFFSAMEGKSQVHGEEVVAAIWGGLLCGRLCRVCRGEGEFRVPGSGFKVGGEGEGEFRVPGSRFKVGGAGEGEGEFRVPGGGGGGGGGGAGEGGGAGGAGR